MALPSMVKGLCEQVDDLAVVGAGPHAGTFLGHLSSVTDADLKKLGQSKAAGNRVAAPYSRMLMGARDLAKAVAGGLGGGTVYVATQSNASDGPSRGGRPEPPPAPVQVPVQPSSAVAWTAVEQSVVASPWQTLWHVLWVFGKLLCGVGPMPTANPRWRWFAFLLFVAPQLVGVVLRWSLWLLISRLCVLVGTLFDAPSLLAADLLDLPRPSAEWRNPLPNWLMFLVGAAVGHGVTVRLSSS